ncbi:KAP family P-loop domain-containing protein [Nostoc sp. CENA543]|uniref:P-loop NTPase fold protein n=1 Tax=Nostoc sp. CENA543 TaxID=1869241 RepID=UPI000CA3205C|nr:P-loop NTPase fold protein [Nostoc sp. CENA543]AUT00154.1 KAP family P-loop domain-containing protein [Nostoc sp. CENA543]
MAIDLRAFFKATDPSRTLFINNSLDSKFYIDFSSVRGGDIIQTLKKRITFFQPDEPTCTLFTGHIGCGKSTELIRLQAELERLGFHVVYFESTDDLEITDVGIADVLLAIARRISQSLDKIILEDTNKFNALLQGALNLLNAEVTGVKAKVPVVGDVGFSAEKEKLSLSMGIGEITTKIKSDPKLREKINQYLAPQKIQLLDAINQELLQPAINKLKQQGKQGLVVIVDNLDRIDNSPKPWGRPQQEYLFVDQGEYLTKLDCHLVYTMPLSLKFSNDYGTLTQRFHEDPKVLPMVSVVYPDGSIHQEGMGLMQQMVLARAFPDLEPAARTEKITEIFDSVSTLERLCIMSGGHVRDLLRLLNSWIMEEMSLPLSRKTLEQVIRSRRNEMMLPISQSEWQLLRDVKRNKRVSDDDGYQKLIRSRFVFEYRDSGESWFDVNPILAEARELNE